MRISEFCGLTIHDIDMKERTIDINHQLQRLSDMDYIIEPTKTSTGKRVLPMTQDVYTHMSFGDARDEMEKMNIV